MITLIKIGLFLLAISILQAGEWQVDKKKENSVVFKSSTTLLDFEGTTDKVDGYLYWEGDSLFGPDNQIYFEIPLATFDTGIGKRDRDMREDVLETEKYPLAVFKGTITESNQNGNQYSLISKGTMSLHGKVQQLVINGNASLNGDELIVDSQFSIFLKDFDIEAPSLMAFVKVAQEIKIIVRLTMKRIS